MNAERPLRLRESDLGSSLLELIVVLGILALALVVSLPLASRSRTGIELRSTALEIAARMRTARANAQLSNVEQALVIDVADRRLWTEGLSSRLAFPPRLGVELDIPLSERVDANAGRVRFYADGSASGGEIRLREGHSKATVSINWLNGDVRVHWNR